MDKRNWIIQQNEEINKKEKKWIKSYFVTKM